MAIILLHLISGVIFSLMLKGHNMLLGGKREFKVIMDGLEIVRFSRDN
jgi:hypothetical protein